MDKTAIKNYAIWARVQLIESCKQRAFEYGVTEDGNYASNLKTVGSRILTDQEVEQRNQLISQIQQKGYTQVMEEAAYTWFNRFVALRFMEVNGYLPSKVRVFTDENGDFKPEILKEAMTIDLEGIDRAVVINFLEKQDNEALYKYLLITQCNALSTGLPYMFEKISNWTELLFPANLLRTDSVVEAMVADIPEEDWTDAVQIIGWLYQYYNSELKDETFALLKKNVKITKERIPAATQLFTPDWIVRYMVENSLGRLWYEGHKDFDKSQWKYYLDEAEQEPEVEAELDKIRAEYSQIRAEEIKVIDPCMGSGHILVYAFDVLMQIYTSVGWSERDAARSIIENNLYGLDIDDRAGQLAYFAVMMKARKYSRRIMSLGIKPNVMSIQDSSFMTNELIDFVAGNDASVKTDLRRIKEVFTDAKEYGSILNVPSLGYEAILERIDEIQNAVVEDIFQIEHRNVAIEQLRPLVMQAMIMSQKYDVVVTNPPYMGGNYSPKLSKYIKDCFPNSKADFFAVFMEKSTAFSKNYIAMITPESWMFLFSYLSLRHYYNSSWTCINCAHLGFKAFDCGFGTTAFVYQKDGIRQYASRFSRLTDCRVEEKPLRLCNDQNTYFSTADRFKMLPNEIMAYWCSEEFATKLCSAKPFGSYYELFPGIKTGNNDMFLRAWFEVSDEKISFSPSLSTLSSSQYKWYLYNKGGGYQKWYGGYEHVVDFERNAFKIRLSVSKDTYRLRKQENYFVHGILWPLVGSDHFSARYLPANVLSDVTSNTIHFHNSFRYPAMAFMNSAVFNMVLNMINPTVSFPIDSIYKVPYIPIDNEKIEQKVKENIDLAKADWDYFEHSWDFKKHPLV